MVSAEMLQHAAGRVDPRAECVDETRTDRRILMPHLSARSFRIVLLATALTGAVAIPAAAGQTPSTPDKGTVNRAVPVEKKLAKNKRAKLDETFDYSLKLTRAGMNSVGEAKGQLDQRSDGLSYTGTIVDRGTGRVAIRFGIVDVNNKELDSRSFTAEDKTIKTNWTFSGEAKAMVVTFCKYFAVENETMNSTCDSRIMRFED
jgi:hypothetical protein